MSSNQEIESDSHVFQTVESLESYLSEVEKIEIPDEPVKCLLNNKDIVSKKQYSIADFTHSANQFEVIAAKNKKLPTIKQDFYKIILSFRGIIFTFLTALSFATCNVILKMSNYLNGSDHCVILFIINGAFNLIIMRVNGIELLGTKGTRLLLFLRGFTGLFAIVFFRFGLIFIAPSDCSAILQSSVIVTAILARIFLKEKLGIPHLLSLILIIQGVIFISKPSFLFKRTDLILSNVTNLTSKKSISHAANNINFNLSESIQIIIGIQFVLLSALFSGILAITIKKLCYKNVHWSVSTMYCSYVGLPFCIVASSFIYFYGVLHGNTKLDLNILIYHILLSCFSSIFAISGQIFLNLSLNFEDASKVAIAKTSEVLFCYILQLIILHIKVDFLSITGSILIICGTVIIMIFKILEKKLNNSENSWYKKFIGIKF